MKRDQRAFTLLEMMIVLSVFALLFSVLMGFFLSSNTAWQKGNRALELQQYARIAMSNSVGLLREAAVSWRVGTQYYNATINGQGTQIDFYLPEFNATNVITTLQQARIYASPSDASTLVRRIGSYGAVQPIGTNIDTDVVQQPWFQFVSADNTLVQVNIPVKKEDDTFNLTSQVRFRNSPQTLTAAVVNEIPVEEH